MKIELKNNDMYGVELKRQKLKMLYDADGRHTRR
jgi:hypothetical protein